MNTLFPIPIIGDTKTPFPKITHFRLNKPHPHPISHTTGIYQKLNFNFRYARLCDLDFPEKKMAKPFANRYPDQMLLQNAVSDVGLHRLPITFLGSSY